MRASAASESDRATEATQPGPVTLLLVERDDVVVATREAATDDRMVNASGHTHNSHAKRAHTNPAMTVDLSEFRGGVYWIALATLRDPALVAELIAQTLEAEEELTAHSF